MKPFWISDVVLLLSVIVLGATSVSGSSCQKRHLIVTVDDYLRLYFDGIEVSGLPHANNLNQPDIVALPCTTRLIAIHGRNGQYGNVAGILASTADDYVLTSSSWKCSNVSHLGWETIDFDDSAWKSAVEYGRNGENNWVSIPVISSNAAWIWLRQWTSDQQEMDAEIYCRKTVSTCYGSTSIIILGVFFGVSVLVIIALIFALLVLHFRK